MTTQQLVPTNGAQVALTPTSAEMNLGDLMRVGKQLAASGFFADAKVEAQAVAKVLAGAELGIAPVASMMGIYFFQGKLSLSANLIAGIIKRTRRYTYKVREWSHEACVLAFYEGAELLGESSFTVADAKQAGLASKDLWKNYTRNLLFARALTNGARVYCPDIFIGGIYTPEEMGAAINGETGEPLAGQTEITREPEPEAVRTEDDARRHFWAKAVECGHITDEGKLSKRKVHDALGVPAEDGALKPWADRLGWDKLRHLLEDGITVAEWTAGESEPDPTDPSTLPFDDGPTQQPLMAQHDALRNLTARGNH